MKSGCGQLAWLAFRNNGGALKEDRVSREEEMTPGVFRSQGLKALVTN